MNIFNNACAKKYLKEDLVHKNVDDDASFNKDLLSALQAFAKNHKNAIASLDELYNGEIQFDISIDTIDGIMRAWGDAAKIVKGAANLYMTDEKLSVVLKPKAFAADKDGNLVISLEIGKDDGKYEDVRDFLKDISNACQQYGLKSDAKFSFYLRGKLLEIEDVVLICHDDDDDATFNIAFTDASVNAGKRSIEKPCLTPKETLKQIQTLFDDYTIWNKEHFDQLKIVCVLEENEEDGEKHQQEVFQIVYPHIKGHQVVCLLQKCTDWKFNDIANDPETMTVKQFCDALQKLSGDKANVFLQSPYGVYGICGVDFINSHASSPTANNAWQMVALKIMPWTDLFESHKSKSNDSQIEYWAHMLDDAFVKC